MILGEIEEKSKGIGADLAGTAGGRDALAARTSHAQHTFTQTTQIHQDNRLGLVKNVALVEYCYFSITYVVRVKCKLQGRLSLRRCLRGPHPIPCEIVMCL